jgi:lysophospholipase L1-like esterase
MKRSFLFILCFFVYSLISSAQVNVLVVGSSTAAGTGASVFDSSWVGRLQLNVRKNLTDGYDTVVTDLAVGGFTSYEVMPTGSTVPGGRPSPDTNHNITKAIRFNPNLILVNLPSNDVGANYPVSEIMNNLRTIVRTGRAAGARVFVTTTQPRTFYTDPQRQILKDLVDSITNYFGSYSINFWDDLVSTDGLFKLKASVDAGDGIHPNDAGHKLLFNRVIAKTLLLPTFTDVDIQNGAFAWNTKPGLIGLPNDYLDSPSKKYPVIVFLHGSGQASDSRDDIKLLSTGLPYIMNHGQMAQGVDSNGKVVKFIVLCVQSPTYATTIGMNNNFSEPQYIYNWVTANYRVDSSRFDWTGLSIGGQGAITAVTCDTGFAKKQAAVWDISNTGFSNPHDRDSAISIGKRYGVKLYTVYGTNDTVGTITDAADKTTTLVNLYNSLSPSPLAVKDRYIGGDHSPTVWNNAYDYSYATNSNNSTGKKMYDWFLQYSTSAGATGGGGPPVDTTSVKIPITLDYIYQDNSQLGDPRKLIDGDTTQNYVPNGPIIYTPHEATVDLYDWNATVSKAKIWVAGNNTTNLDVIVVRKRDNAEINIGTFTGATGSQHFTYTNSDTAIISKVIFRSQNSNHLLGSEIELWGTYTTPPTVPKKARRPLGFMAGANGHSSDLMNDAKINVIKSMYLSSYRNYEEGSDITDVSGNWKFEPELGSGRYSADSAFHILKNWNPNFFSWNAVVSQYADQKNSWNVIDDFPNKYVRGTVNSYIDHGGYGEVFIHVIAVAGSDDVSYGQWYVYKGGVQINITSTPEYLSSSLIGQDRHENVGGGLGLSVGDTLTFYKSQLSVNPIFFTDNSLARRNTDSAHLRSGQAMFTFASRGGKNLSVPDYPIQSGQRMTKGTGLYSAVEPSNEINHWWDNFDNFWNGKTAFYHWSQAYDGSKGLFTNSGAKQADTSMVMIATGLATDQPDIIHGAIVEARLRRGFKANGTIDVPFDVINNHIYSSAEGQYGFGNTGGLPPEQGMIPQCKRLVWLQEHFAPDAQVFISEWGWDQHPSSPLRAGKYGSYDREAVGAFWMVRAMLTMDAVGIDRSQYFNITEAWPESVSDANGGQFATMRLMRQPVDSNADSIVRSRQGDYLAQLMEFRDYTYLDSIPTGTAGVYAYKYKNNSDTIIALWSEEITSIVADTTQFAERAGTINLPITAGGYKIRTFKDDGSAVMGSSTIGTSTGTVTFSYAAKPIIIQTNQSAPANEAPNSVAGSDQTITLPTSSVTLSGSGTDADGTIASYQWTQVSGPNTANIYSASSASTLVDGLAQGTYVFRLTVTDDDGATDFDDVQITVNAGSSNQPPVSNAGSDRLISLPTNSLTLFGSGTDADGYVAFYEWSQVSGPSTANFSFLYTATPVVSNLVPGTYVFRLKVTDNNATIATDDIQVTVSNHYIYKFKKRLQFTSN